MNNSSTVFLSSSSPSAIASAAFLAAILTALADKSDAHRSRVSKKDRSLFDKHDEVNYAVTHSELKIDTKICPVIDYFEIFMDRTQMSKKAAKYLGLWFELIINDTNLL